VLIIDIGDFNARVDNDSVSECIKNTGRNWSGRASVFLANLKWLLTY
jgi:hypothetical protein